MILQAPTPWLTTLVNLASSFTPAVPPTWSFTPSDLSSIISPYAQQLSEPIQFPSEWLGQIAGLLGESASGLPLAGGLFPLSEEAAADVLPPYAAALLALGWQPFTPTKSVTTVAG